MYISNPSSSLCISSVLVQRVCIVGGLLCLPVRESVSLSGLSGGEEEVEEEEEEEGRGGGGGSFPAGVGARV